MQEFACMTTLKTIAAPTAISTKDISLAPVSLLCLNEKERIQEKESLEIKAMEIENKHRVAKGKTPFKDLATYKADKEKEDEEREAANAEPQKAINLDEDPLLNETGYILLDLLEMTDDASGKRVADIKQATSLPLPQAE